MIVKLIQKTRSKMRDLKLSLIKKDINDKVTLIGNGHNFGTESRVSLREGASRENIVLHDHSEMFGTLYAIHKGTIIMGEWSKIGPGCVIEATNKVEIGKDTAIGARVTIRDNNSHPISPAYRRMMRHTPMALSKEVAQEVLVLLL